MRSLILALLALFVAPVGYADVTQSTPTPLTYTLKRGTTAVKAAGTAGTVDDCWATARADAAARAVTATYTCTTATQTATETYRAAPVQCASTQPPDDSQQVSATCPAGTYGSYPWTQTRSYTLFMTPTCWQPGAWSPTAPPAPAPGVCSTTAPAGYTTNFPLTENPISENGKWLGGLDVGVNWKNARTLPGLAYGGIPTTGYDDSVAILATSFPPDQYVQGTVYRAPGYSPGVSHEIELHIRGSITAYHIRTYEILWGITGELNIVRWNDTITDYTALLGVPSGPNIGAPVDGDVLRVEMRGSVISVFKNGALVASLSTTTYTSGQPGIGFWPTTNGTLSATPSSYGWKSFSAGPL